TVMPGFQYDAPPTQNKMNAYDTTGAEVLKYIDFNSGIIAKQLLNHFEGFSPLITNEMVNRRQFMTTETLTEAFDTVMGETKETSTTVFHTNHDTAKQDFYSMNLEQFYDDDVIYEPLHDLLDTYSDSRCERERVKRRPYALVKFVQQQL